MNDVPGAIVGGCCCCCLRLPAVGIRLGGMGIDCCCCCDSEDRSAARLIVLASWRGSREAAVTTGGWPGINLVAAMMKKGERERERITRGERSSRERLS